MAAICVWDDVAAHLAADFRLVRYDLRGHGLTETATPPELGRALARLIPVAKFSLIENAAHLFCIEQPETVTQQMLRFFREVQIV